MTKKTVRAGIIGSGFAAQFHLDALQRVSVALISVVGVYSRNPQNSENFASKNDLTPFYSLEELINS
ncbi:hypothetical protein LCGC14_2817810, partial [marine sediment metagenome]